MAELEFRKDKKKPNYKPIEETPAAKPKNRYNIDSMPSISYEPTKKKKVGRPRTSNLTAVARVSDDNLDRIKALKEALSLDSQDEAIGKALDSYIPKLDENHKRLYDALLIVQKNKRH